MAPKQVQGPKEILLDGRVYDVSSFRHPGGSIIKFFYPDAAVNYEIPDASEAWHSFHPRSQRARNLLKALPSRAYVPEKDAKTKYEHATTETEPVVKDFVKLREDLVAEGFFEPSYAHVAYRLGEILALFYIGYKLVIWGWAYTGLMIMGVAMGRCGWLEHEGGHVSLTGNRWLDIKIQILVYGLGDGMSAKFWRNQHNKHHAAPQRIQHDVDLDTLPLLAFNAKIAKLANGLGKHWLRFQALAFPSITCLLVVLFWQLFLHPRHSIRTKSHLEVACYVSRWTLIWYLFGHFGFQRVVYMYLFATWFAANYIFVQFALSHTHKPVSDESAHVNWVRYASDYTINIDDSWWCNWLMSYLNFQIEHHLFPAMPQFRIPLMKDRVKALFHKHGLEYDCCSYTTALSRTFSNLHEVGSGHGNDVPDFHANKPAASASSKNGHSNGRSNGTHKRRD